MTLSYSLFRDIVKYIYICLYLHRETLESYTRAYKARFLKEFSWTSCLVQGSQGRSDEYLHVYLWYITWIFEFHECAINFKFFLFQYV